MWERKQGEPTLSCQEASPTHSLEWDSSLTANIRHVPGSFQRVGTFLPPLLFGSQTSQTPSEHFTHVVSWWSARCLAHGALPGGMCSHVVSISELSKPSHSATQACQNSLGRGQHLSGAGASVGLPLPGCTPASDVHKRNLGILILLLRISYESE